MSKTIMDAITQLQNQEQALILVLNTTINNDPTNAVAINQIKGQINDLSDQRIALFENLKDQASYLQTGVSNSRADLVAQETLLNVVEQQLTSAKTTLSGLQNKNDTKLRMVEINTYYGKRYEAQSELMKLIIFVCVPVIILYILKKKGFIPETLANYLIGITIAVSAIFVIRKVWDISMRSNMDYDEYDWKFEDPADYAPSIWEYNKKHFFNFENPLKDLIGNLGLCVGSDCCANGLYFDTEKQKCTNREHYENLGGKLCGTPVVRYEEELNKNGVAPFSYSTDYSML